LGLKNWGEWRAYCQGERPDLPARPMNIPREARYIYGVEFRARGACGAWLGTANRKGGWRTYDDALTFVHGLKLKDQAEWQAYCRGQRPDLPKKPIDVPAGPGRVYGAEFCGRGGITAWLGSSGRRTYRTYEEGVGFARAWSQKPNGMGRVLSRRARGLAAKAE